MDRFFNRESAVVIFGSLAGVVFLCRDSGLGWGQTAGVGFIWTLIAIVLAMKLHGAIIPLYLRIGFNKRALDLAIQIRDGSPNRKFRDASNVDVAMVQIAMGKFEAALRNLDSIKIAHWNEPMKALIIANRAYCRAHCGKRLERALEEAREATRLSPDEGIFPYFEGLVLHKLGRNEEAKPLIESSLEREKDPSLPVPGERPWILSRVEQALGDTEGAAAHLAEAAKQSKHSPFAAIIAEASE